MMVMRRKFRLLLISILFSVYCLLAKLLLGRSSNWIDTKDMPLLHATVKNHSGIRYIHFLRTSPQRSWDLPTLCAVFAAARYNPDFTVLVHILSKLSYPSVWKNLTNIKIERKTSGNLFELLINTPLLDWYPEFLKKGKTDVFRILSDALRMAIVVSK